MNFLSKLFKRGADADVEEKPIALDPVARAPQLLRLEQALDALANEMRIAQSVDNPGWRGRVNEYSMLAGDAMALSRACAQRSDTLTREAVLDLVFAVRPVFSGAIPAGLESLGPLQNEAMAAAEDLRELLPSERG
jgi:hypothetical protein